MYNYCDVVSEGELDAWDSKPFEPRISDCRFYLMVRRKWEAAIYQNIFLNIMSF